MSETIQQIATRLAEDLRGWLEQPDDASLGLHELRERLGALRGALGAGATSGALKELSGAEKSIRATRQREAADTIAASCRELGVILEPKAPLKRAPRRNSATPRPAPASPETVGETSPTNTPSPEAERERSGLLSRLRTAQ